ncbi:MAG: Rpn family recombination-promoting nuclease/putative transposase [Lachnospiraceae bacterium]|nr:Rpn family recombination-promoting nuclease/putative transposase [Lachnospiraceae bacterium]
MGTGNAVVKWKYGIHLVMLACENQERIHYAMPVRNMLYDSLSYTEQIRRLHEMSQAEPKRNLTRAEFLSRFRKDDKLCPVITLVLYYGEEPWDGSVDLYGMLNGEEIFRKSHMLQQYIPNYKINLVEPERMDDLEMFCTDLHEIFGMLKYRNNKSELIEYVNNREEFFRNVDEETYYVIREFLHSEKVLKAINRDGGEERVDMCQALEELYNDGIEKGKSEGIRQGQESERLNIAKNLLGILDVSTIAEKVGLPVETVMELKVGL